MAQDGFPKDEMRYDALAQEALRGVVKAALKRAAAPDGLPGAHHFYITVRTVAPGVSLPPDLLAKYPEDMTIVLQHQYWDLAPGETFFAVTLKFGGAPRRLSIPYAAVTRFYDPSVQFLLQFEAPEPAPVEEAKAALPQPDTGADAGRGRGPEDRLAGQVPEEVGLGFSRAFRRARAARPESGCVRARPAGVRPAGAPPGRRRGRRSP